MNLTEQAAKLTELRAEIIALAERDGDLPEQDAARYAEALTEFDTLKADHDESWTRAAEYAVHEQAVRSFEAGAYESSDSIADRSINVIVGDKDPFDERYQRDVGTFEAAKRSIGENKRMDGDAQTAVERKLMTARTDPAHMRGIDEYLLAHSSDAYTRGWAKLVTGQGWAIEPDERNALMVAQRYAQRWDPERAVTLTAANGGSLIPAHLDPSVIIVNTGSANPYRQISNVVSINTNVWNGVTSAGMSFAVSTEGGDSSDIAPTFGTKAITVAKAHGTIPVTIEAFEDIDGLTTLLPAMLQDAKDRFEVDKFTDGSGTNEPKGVVASVYAESSRRSTHSTNSAMTVNDVIDAQNALGARWQSGASWIGSLTYLNRVRLLGSSSYSTWTDRLNEGLGYNIAGKPAYEVSDMSTALSTATNTAFVYGDFSNYNIVDRIGMSIEYVPHLFSSGNNLPNGRRGFYAYYRVGADVTTVTAFVVSTNPGA